MQQLNTIEKTLNKGDICVFQDEWLERRLYGFSKYEVIYSFKAEKKVSVKEITTGQIYSKINIKELRILN